MTIVRVSSQRLYDVIPVPRHWDDTCSPTSYRDSFAVSHPLTRDPAAG
ncbi:hypothetical protein [Wolbachia pipientis]|uniref:Uncharacterized protein n=1 Tax=Wolbachia pipientis TaxID=955 RepID=A0A7G5CBV6_WOLPI|nr:hypothetical protein [Wolbachia pipientis]QMV46690.1 hypothetical protein HC356_00745 [Wolbachia pipientis]